MQKSVWKHLRIPFSLYLMPVFAFAACQYPFADIPTLILSFVAIHAFLYPSDNGYTSYFEKKPDTSSPVQVTIRPALLRLSIAFELCGLLIAFYISREFAVMLLIYGLVSKSLYFPAIRLKRFGFFTLLLVALLQGGFAYLMSTLALHHLHLHELLEVKYMLPAALCSGMILGFYPLTQIYQHKYDREHGNKTASLILGVNGTFIFCAVVFFLGNAGFYLYFLHYFKGVIFFILFQVFLSPLYAYFLLWYFAWIVDDSEANFHNAMLLNKIAAACLMSFFIMVAIVENWF